MSNNTLLNILTDADYRDTATLLHNKFHPTHRVLQQMMLNDRFWNPNSELLAIDITKHCSNCEMFEKFQKITVALPDMVKVPIFSRWHLDFAGPLPPTGDARWFILAADYTSNLILTLPCEGPNSDAAIRMILFIYQLFGKPKEIVSDNGSAFTSEILDILTNLLKVTHKYSSAIIHKDIQKLKDPFKWSRS